MTPKKPDIDLVHFLDRRQLLKGLGVAGSVMALGGPGRHAELLAADTPSSGT
ncbi:MAG: twin-arginine translocation signal domain-containing protein [Nitrospira sp.]|nr:twin-arginine translocation signal domain-containing protein [Nitrospira sp.]